MFLSIRLAQVNTSSAVTMVTIANTVTPIKTAEREVHNKKRIELVS